MAKVEALPCPFCGSDSIIMEFDAEQWFKWGAARCLECEARGPVVRTGYDQDVCAPWRCHAIEAWNERATCHGRLDRLNVPPSHGNGG